MNHAIFVDLSNFYGSCLKSKIDDPKIIRDYFIEWLDFDRISFHLTGKWSPVWVFYSKDRIGPSNFRIEKEYQDSMIQRFNRQIGVTARDVNIPGEQRENFSYKCSQCNHENIIQTKGEKGVDASLTVHLFETMESWDSAYLLSGDADFVPVVSSLRRLGKNIIVVSSQNTSEALIRESYEFQSLDYLFLKEDIEAYKLFRKGGFLDNWLTTPDNIAANNNNEFTNSFRFRESTENLNIPIENIPILLEANSFEAIEKNITLTISSRNIVNKELKIKDIINFFHNERFCVFYEKQGSFSMIISRITILGISRRLNEMLSRITNISKGDFSDYYVDCK